MRKIAVACVLLLVLGAFGFGFYLYHTVPDRIWTSLQWEPALDSGYADTIVVVDMGVDDGWPQLWRSLGHFVEQAAKATIVVRNYRDVDQAEMDSIQPRAVVLTGFHHELADYNLSEMEDFFAFLRETTLPVLGVCGGHQFMGRAFGSDIVALGFYEDGFIEVNIRPQRGRLWLNPCKGIKLPSLLRRQG